jgi:hypothetical protein
MVKLESPFHHGDAEAQRTAKTAGTAESAEEIGQKNKSRTATNLADEIEGM